jgi:proton-coupled amino acid transporter
VLTCSVIYIGGNETAMLTKRGIAEVQLFNKDSFPLLIGTAVFAFEGIGLVIPITESMREPQKFPRALTGVMFAISFLFAGAGVLGYAAYGKEVCSGGAVPLCVKSPFYRA